MRAHIQKIFSKENWKTLTSDMNFSLTIAIITVSAFLSFQSKFFFSVKNFLNIGLAGSVTGIMAAGLTLSMIMGAFDLSQYSVATLSSVIAITAFLSGVPVWVCLLIALATGMLCGTFNGIMVTVFKINPIITTLGTQMVFRSLCYIITGSKIMNFSHPALNFLGRGYLLGVPMSVWILLFIYTILSFIVKYTSFGREIYAVGANSNASFLAGINIRKIRIGGLIVSSTCASIAGLLAACQVGASIPANGVGAEMEVTTAVLLGGLSLGGGKGKLSGTFLGLILIIIINNGLTLLSIQSYYQMLVRGGVLVLAVLIDSVRGGGYK